MYTRVVILLYTYTGETADFFEITIFFLSYSSLLGYDVL